MPSVDHADATVIEPGSASRDPSGGSDPSLATAAELSSRPPRTIGRYLILEELGAGGMGRVYLAYDPKLRRELALKVLRHSGDADEATRGRMLREAQAQAQLSHPNVVSVYDVETEAGDLHIAMEYVRGRTMADWLTATKPDVPEILAILREAGAGLLAAHQAGLVHRDFKPSNVLIGDDGRVRVMDFGLARGRDDADDIPYPRSRGADVSSSYTIAGTVVGTPMYMAPEQYVDAELDARTDQYAFCVTLVSTLCGRSPFASTDFKEVGRRKLEGEIEIPSELPKWLVPIVRRGLSPKLVDRWPSMHELLELLADDPAQRRQRWLSVAGVGVAIAAAALAIGLREPPSPGARAQVCAGSELALARVWNDVRRERARAAFARTELTYAGRTWTQVERRLDDWSDAWIERRTRACEATHVHAEQSEALLDQRMHCYARRLDELDALVSLLEKADVALVGEALGAASGLADPSSCEAAQMLGGRELPTTPKAQAELAALSRELGRASALVAAGRYAEGKQIAISVEADAAELGYPWIEIEAALTTAGVLGELGELDDARERLEQAVARADQSGEDYLRLTALIALMRQAMFHDGKLDVARDYRRAAAAVLARLDSPPLARVDYLSSWGSVLGEVGPYDEAIELLTTAIELAEVHAPSTADRVRANLGAVYIASGQHEQALAIHEAQLRELEAALGSDHPAVADALANVGISLQALGEHERAVEVLDRLVILQQRFRGPSSPDTADAYNNRAVAYGLLERHDEAAADYERARAIWAAIAPGNPHYGVASFNLSETHLYRDQPEQALALLDEAGAIFATALPPDHPYNDYVLTYRGWALLELGRLDEAVEVLGPAVERLRQNAIDPRTEAQAGILLGEARLRGGELEAGRALIEAALPELEPEGYWSRRAAAELSRSSPEPRAAAGP